MIYLDNAATTSANNMVFLPDLIGNPSAPYSLGRKAKLQIETARKQFARCINAQPEEVIFTSGGSESDNMAVKGVAFAHQNRGKHIITSMIEHSAVYNSCKWLERQGFSVTYLPVDHEGFVSPEDVASAIDDETILVSIMMANNEIGTIQPIKEIKAAIGNRPVLFHTDAVQAFGAIPIDVDDLGVDLLSISAHKFHGPKGVGVLYIRKGTIIDPLIHGGNQEFGYRAGTENVLGIVNAACEAEFITQHPEKYTEIYHLRNKMMRSILEKIPGSFVNGTSRIEKRLPNNCNICISDVPAEVLILRLDLEDIYVSSGAACTSGDMQPSRTLKAIGRTDDEALSSIRVTLSDTTTREDINKFVDKLTMIVKEIRDNTLE